MPTRSSLFPSLLFWKQTSPHPVTSPFPPSSSCACLCFLQPCTSTNMWCQQLWLLLHTDNISLICGNLNELFHSRKDAGKMPNLLSINTLLRMHLPYTAVHYLQRPSWCSEDNQRNCLRITCCLLKTTPMPILNGNELQAGTQLRHSMANPPSWDISIIRTFYDAINFTILQLQVLIIMKTISTHISLVNSIQISMPWKRSIINSFSRAFWLVHSPLMISSLFMHKKSQFRLTCT